MLNLTDSYILDINTSQGKQSEIVCRWNGEDFTLTEDLNLGAIQIKAGDPLNNRTIINSIRKEES